MKSKAVAFIVILFALVYAGISLVNHYNFRTYALDLGLYTNALYDYAHFQLNFCETFLSQHVNLLADHFDLLLPLIAPFSFILKSWTLLIFQWLFLVAGGYGFYRFFMLRFGDHRLSLFAMVFYFLQFGIFTALSYDYHSNVIAVALVPWLLLFLQQSKLLPAAMLLILILIAKENMSLWMGFFLSGLIWIYRERKVRYFLAGSTLFSMIYFVVVAGIIMPRLSSDGRLSQFSYSILGGDFSHACYGLFDHPSSLFKALFQNHLGALGVEGVKEEWWIYFLLSGGIMLLFRPVLIWMLIPIFLQKMWSDKTQTWGVNDHYSIELVPVLTLGAVFFIQDLIKERYRSIVMFLAGGLALFSTISIMDRPVVFLRKEQVRIYQAEHWRSPVDKDAFSFIVSRIPDDAVVSVQSCLLPRLAWRDNCYAFPLVKNARYILVASSGQSFPLKAEAYQNALDTLERSVFWEEQINQSGIHLFVKKK